MERAGSDGVRIRTFDLGVDQLAEDADMDSAGDDFFAGVSGGHDPDELPPADPIDTVPRVTFSPLLARYIPAETVELALQ